jgi:hypothetical protein
MTTRAKVLAVTGGAALMAALVLRAVTVHSVSWQPVIYRVTANTNDLDAVEGIAAPGVQVQLWYRQRNFKEGTNDGEDRFAWCGWKNGGNPVFLGSAIADSGGVWRMSGLRQRTTVMMMPAAGAAKTCLGGIYTELLPRACDASGCSQWTTPTMHWLNVRKPNGQTGTAAGSVSGADQAALAVADGPNDGPEMSSVYDVDQNGIDTTQPGLTRGQRITWKCGAGGTAGCPSVTVHDATTITAPDPEYPFVLGTLQAHRGGGSVIAAAAVPRGQDLGFAVNVNLKFRGRLDINLGCDQAQPFDFLNF